MTATPIPLYRVHVAAPVSYIPTGPTTGVKVGTPTPGSFDPAAVRVVPAADIRPGDVVLGTCQPRHDRRTLMPLDDRAQWVSYFTGTPKVQQHGARPFDAGHCDWCAHNAFYMCITPGSGHVVVDGCTVYPPGALLLAIPRTPGCARAA
ncbi:hypothetical protein ACFYZ8_33325 [Streptomyces sp. NPDC001668]|uniref:hypothetical protein n=1 Tax=Streptomyces sp. NPDC001668 TaxID=3364598 RepID=UPI0036A7552B